MATGKRRWRRSGRHALTRRKIAHNDLKAPTDPIFTPDTGVMLLCHLHILRRSAAAPQHTAAEMVKLVKLLIAFARDQRRRSRSSSRASSGCSAPRASSSPPRRRDGVLRRSCRGAARVPLFDSAVRGADARRRCRVPRRRPPAVRDARRRPGRGRARVRRARRRHPRDQAARQVHRARERGALRPLGIFVYKRLKRLPPRHSPTPPRPRTPRPSSPTSRRSRNTRVLLSLRRRRVRRTRRYALRPRRSPSSTPGASRLSRSRRTPSSSPAARQKRRSVSR